MSNKTIIENLILEWESNGYKVVKVTESVTIMKNNSNGKYIKIDEDGMIVPFHPLCEYT